MNEESNSLVHAESAYLRSAMHQPVHWHEWGKEVFAKATAENKPILLDIGAVWCHWCHVMDRESYENAETARLINENFIAVKVDRDERPDVDARYQAAIFAISKQGGWPLTAFLLPDGRPFWGGTYFPAVEQAGRPSFRQILDAIAQAHRDRQGDVLESASAVMTMVAAESFAGDQGQIDPSAMENIVAGAKRMFDSEYGGFGKTPKFPHTALIDALIGCYVRTGDKSLRSMFVVTLDRMARGGVYDQLGGGFHRYSVDQRWVVPHFEKMSYDNAGLLLNYVHAWQATGIEFFAEVARGIIRWMDGWLSDQEHGGFFSSQDADISLDDDGDYFTWTLAEASAVLSGDELEVAALHYDIGVAGEMHHNPAKNVLYQHIPVEEVARRLGLSLDQVGQLLESARRKLYEARNRRQAPYVDRTMYVGWNAYCVSAYLQAARALGLDEARHFALRSLDRILGQGWSPERGLRHAIASADGKATSRHVPGVLDDYVFLTMACLDAYESTADMTYFNFAHRIADAMIGRFGDREGGGFFDSDASSSERLGALSAPRKPFQDGPLPSGCATAALALLRLYSYTEDENYRTLAEKTLEVFVGAAPRFGIAGSRMPSRCSCT